MTTHAIELVFPVTEGINIRGDLNIPPESVALVIFSHGSGSSRFSVRNRFVAENLNKHKLATLLVDLLTLEEDQEYSNRFNIELLTDRLVKVTTDLRQRLATSALPIGYFGASTGAASALRAAARLPDIISAVVSRGGRPDLAAGTLGKVLAPTLLIVGSLDQDVLMLNRKALAVLPCEKKLEIVEGASHLFEERGKLDEVAQLAASWFEKFMIPHGIPPNP